MPKNRIFSEKLFHLALPMMLEQFLMSSLFIFDTVFVGALGDEYLGAVGQAGNIIMLLWCGFFALSSAGSIFVAQYWGKNKDQTGIRKSFTAGLMFSMLLAIIFFVLSFFFSGEVMSVLTIDDNVRRIGAEYLRIVSFIFPIWSALSVLAGTMRSMGMTKKPMIASITGAVFNIVFDGLFVGGSFGLPKLGVPAAAISTVAGGVIEFLMLVFFARRSDSPITARRRDIVWPGREMVKRYLKTALPLAAKDQLWAGGVTVYSISFAALGVAATAAYNVYGTLVRFMDVLFMALGNAGGILIGHELGAAEIERAKNYAWRLIRMVFLSSLAICPIFILLRDLMLLPYPNLTPEAIGYARESLLLGSLIIWARGINYTNMDGILRAGGDTFGAAAIDIGMLWFFGVPLTVLAGMMLHLPFITVILMTCLEEVVKVGVSLFRVKKYKWAKQLV